MRQIECNELRDILFEEQFNREWVENKFRYLAIIEGKADEPASLHFAYANAVWRRAKQDCSQHAVEQHIRELISNTKYSEENISITYNDYMSGEWMAPWGLTAKEPCNNMPLLILFEEADGAVNGVMMREPHMGHDRHRFESKHAEINEVQHVLETLRQAGKDSKHYGWYKDTNVSATSLDLALRECGPGAYQKHVLIYRNDEWFHGLWTNNEEGEPRLDLWSVADNYPIRISKAKRSSRKGLEALKGMNFLEGDYSVLENACGISLETGRRDLGTYEDCLGVKTLCNWWNTHAAENLRSAKVFRIYIWNSNENIFECGDPEEPSRTVEQLDSSEVSAIFRKKGRPLVVAAFQKGREHNIEGGRFGVQTFYVNGECAFEIGCNLEEVDEAYFSMIGLQCLARKLNLK